VLLILFGTCGAQTQIMVSSATFSTYAMSIITKAYVNRSRMRIMSLKERNSSLTKDDSNVYDYLCSIYFIDELALIDHSFKDLVFVIVALNGLNLAYREFCALIHNS